LADGWRLELRVLGGGVMPGPDLYRKYRRLIEGVADEPRSTELSRAALRDLLKQFETEAGALNSSAANFVCDEIAGQLEQEALRSTSKHHRRRSR
jgi:hypothetical protein